MKMLWIAYDTTRLIAGLAIVVMLFLPGSPEPVVTSLVIYVLFGLMVSYIRWAEGFHHD